TGDITQTDLPKRGKSGLKDAVETLAGIDGIKIFTFEAGDVVRHRLVAEIVAAYGKTQKKDVQQS
ncbi:MAG: PhoH family protein, partial [Opitutales bacterium]|nr:PhoH family protein [Opitutales bacterium]